MADNDAELDPLADDDAELETLPDADADGDVDNDIDVHGERVNLELPVTEFDTYEADGLYEIDAIGDKVNDIV